MVEPGLSPAQDPDVIDGFRRAYALDLLGSHEEAFAELQRANTLAASPTLIEHEAAFEREHFAGIKAAFTASAIKRHAGEGNLSTAPIFIVGTPRSGSTLVEQIISSHPIVQGMGEQVAYPHAASQVESWLPAPGHSDHFRTIATRYLTAIKHEGWRESSRFTDKLPMNFRYIGSVAVAFPGATILHSVRDPMDTCFSQYRQLFDGDLPYAFDLSAIGRSYVRYRQLMDHWAEVLPGRVIDVRHEDLVADPERTIRWLITEACGLAWNDQCLRFYGNSQPVLTASRDQVRQPIFTSSIGRWRNYEKHLAPLMEALGDYGPATP